MGSALESKSLSLVNVLALTYAHEIWVEHLQQLSMYLVWPSGQTPQGQTRTQWRGYIFQLAFVRLGVLQDLAGGSCCFRQTWLSLFP